MKSVSRPTARCRCGWRSFATRAIRLEDCYVATPIPLGPPHMQLLALDHLQFFTDSARGIIHLMAGYKGHIVGAVAVNMAYVGVLRMMPTNPLDSTNYIVTEWQLFAGPFIVAVLFGLFPDIDTNSIGQNIFFGLAFVADVLLIATGRLEAAAYLGLLAMTPIVGHHRGWTHSKLAMFLVPLPKIGRAHV